jgi:hypothetical protein
MIVSGENLFGIFVKTNTEISMPPCSITDFTVNRLIATPLRKSDRQDTFPLFALHSPIKEIFYWEQTDKGYIFTIHRKIHFRKILITAGKLICPEPKSVLFWKTDMIIYG